MAEWSTKQALSVLIGSTCLTLTLSLWGYFHWTHSRQSRLFDPRYRLTTLVQTGPEKEPLPTTYLAELLNLSTTQPTSLYALDLNKARAKLLASPLIAHATVKRLPPSALYIDYAVRHPIAILADYHNTGIDASGYIFPLAPFFSAKDLPELYLGLPPFGAPADHFGRAGGLWQTPLQNRYVSLALDILQFLQHTPSALRVQRIDVSNAFAPTLGSREVVLFTEEELQTCIFPKILRLMPKDYPQQLTHFFSLQKAIADDYQKQLASRPPSGRFAPRIVDLRIPKLAFVQND